jgi:O-antigen/teichoic acid export membrane protein
MFLFESAFVAVGDVPKYVQVIIGESAMETGSSIAIVLLGGGLIGATAGRALGYAAGALLAMVISARRFCWTSVQRGPRRPPLTRSIMGNAAPIMLVDGANAVFTMIDILLIGAFLGSRDAGLFSAPTRLLVVFFYPALAISNGIGPRLARIGGRDPDASSLAIGIRGLILFYSLLLAPLVIWARPIVHLLLGSGYGGSVATMRILAITVLLGGLAPLVSVSANYLGEVRMRVPLMIGATLLDAAIDVVLIPRIGIISGAIATAAAYALMVGGHIAICRRHIDLPLRRMAMSTLRAVVAAVAMGGVLAAIGSDPSIPLGVAGLVAGTAVYAVALIGLGEFSGSELAVARRRLRV